jgi:hypothetical protein
MLGFTCRWVSIPLRDITRARLRFFAMPPTHRFDPSSGFHNLSTVSSALELAGLFHPAATSRVRFRPGASLPSQPPFLIGRSLPPCRCCIAAPARAPTFIGSRSGPRALPLGFEAFICAGPRSSGLVIHRARSRSPLRISCSSRISLSRRRPPLSRSPTAHDVTRSVFAIRTHLSMGAVAITCEVSPSMFARATIDAILVQYSKRSFALFALTFRPGRSPRVVASRRSCFASCSPYGDQLLRAQQARSRPWPDLLASRARHLAVFRARSRSCSPDLSIS